jgi:hypothetical protein
VRAETDKVARPVHWSSAGLREAIAFWLVEKAIAKRCCKQIAFKVSMYKKVEIVKVTMYVQEG